MSIKIIHGDTLSAVDKAIFGDIGCRRDKVTPIVLIVPDQYSQAIERELFAALKIKCSFDIDVMSFTRLARSRMTNARQELNQQTGVLLMSRIIHSNYHNFKCYREIAKNKQFANQMYAIITSLRNNMLTVPKIKDAARCAGGYLEKKLTDIIMVMEEYNKEINKNYSDISSLLDDFREGIDNIESIKQTHFYIFGFYDMTANKRAIVEKLMQNAASVTLGIVDTTAASNSRLMPADSHALINMAKRHHASSGRVVDECLSTIRQEVADQILGYNIKQTKATNQHYRLIRARNVHQEIIVVAQYIRQKIVEGYRYKDISIVVEDISQYKLLIAKEFKKYGIVYFMDDSVSVESLPYYKIIKSILSVIASGYDRDYLLEYVKQAGFVANYGHKAEFENYIYRYNLDKYMLNKPFHYGSEQDRYYPEQIRIKAMENISMLGGNKSNASDYIPAFKKVIDWIYQNRATIINHDDDQSKELMEVGYNKILVSLEQANLMLEGVKMTLPEIGEILLDCLASIEVSLAPIKSDCVFVGGLKDSRFESCKIMLLLGAVADSYPNISADRGILRDADIAKLEEGGIIIEPRHSERVKQSKFYISQLAIRAKDETIFSCPHYYNDVATIMSQLSMLTRTEIKLKESNIVYGDSREEIARKIATKSNIIPIVHRHIGGGDSRLSSLMSYLIKQIDTKELNHLKELANPIYVSTNTSATFKNNFVKISGFERYFECPFKFFAESMVQLKERPIGNVQINEMGSFIHYVLEVFMREVNDQSKELNIDDKVSKIVNMALLRVEFLHFDRQDSSGNYVKHLTRRCQKIVSKVYDLYVNSVFRPTHLEYSFGMPDSKARPLTIMADNEEFSIRGYIDRVDTYQDEAIVIDYKSSHKAFTIKEVFGGLRLQLVVYLNAVARDIAPNCSGLYYLPLPYKFQKEEQQDQEIPYSYCGFITNNPSKIALQDPKFLTNTSSYLPIKYKKSRGTQEYYPILYSDNVLSQEKFDQLRSYADKLISHTIGLIKNGFISAVHTSKSCEYCGFGNLCLKRNDSSSCLASYSVKWSQDNLPSDNSEQSSEEVSDNG